MNVFEEFGVSLRELNDMTHEKTKVFFCANCSGGGFISCKPLSQP